MEQRKAVRVGIKGQMSAKMILVEIIDILDISMTGIRFRCARQVDMKSPHTLRVGEGDVSARLKGRVVRSTFKGLHQAEGGTLPSYEVAMHFEKMSEQDKKSLEKLISILCHE